MMRAGGPRSRKTPYNGQNSPQDMHFDVLRRRPLVEQAPAIGYP
jgi:hypothetical protein